MPDIWSELEQLHQREIELLERRLFERDPLTLELLTSDLRRVRRKIKRLHRGGEWHNDDVAAGGGDHDNQKHE